ncbi:putative SAUR-like auxin-responsive protein family [Hibiscus syriacus]|uniref:SAUR-like auxin-responsive protein family n=1 Tax=Hibiscus syriacus TaxID=106335 RepID=A0A6A3CYE4_HIBSY|nr:auxin-responsive protein SAUR71-like [Hibiscus syriacus]KAE8734350.1 putative SAUR-like auxin-responsive protein family [Hibiscus syriacus]
MVRQLSRMRASYKRIREQARLNIRKGYVPVMVGRDDEKDGAKFLIHLDVFRNEYFVGFLEMVALEVGYQSSGVLRIPCRTECFMDILNQISRMNT